MTVTTPFDVDGFLDALRNLDADGIMDYFSPDVEIETPVLGEPLAGRDRVGEWMVDALPAMGNLEVVPERVVEEAGHVAIYARARGTYDRDLEIIPGKPLRVGGKCFDLPVAAFLDVNDEGRITRFTRIVDNWLALRQLELPPSAMDELVATLEARV